MYLKPGFASQKGRLIGQPTGLRDYRSMSKSHSYGLRRTDRRHSKDDALNRREYELLLEGCHEIDDDYYALQAKFVALVAGRLGLRAGEIAHMLVSGVPRL